MIKRALITAGLLALLQCGGRSEKEPVDVTTVIVQGEKWMLRHAMIIL